MANPLQFNMGEKKYEVHLTPKTNQDAPDSVLIGGREYVVGGQKEAVALFKEKTQGLKLDSIQLEDLQNKFSELNNSIIPQIAKINLVGKKALIPNETIIRYESQKSQVLNEIVPSWPIPGTSPTSTITDRMKELNVQGARVTVINGPGDVWTEGFGELARPHLRIQAASISKTITSLTVMSLIQEGVKTRKGDPLNLETNIRDILDPVLWRSISKGKEIEITIRQLMSHTAGLEEDTTEGYRGYFRDTEAEIAKSDVQIAELLDELKDIESKDTTKPEINEHAEKIRQRITSLLIARERTLEKGLPSLDEILKGEGTNSPPVAVSSNPGSQFAYAGGGAMILQKVIEIIAKEIKLPQQTFEAIVKERIFDKLGMDDSSFSPEEKDTVQGNGEDGKPLPGKWVQQPELAAAGLWTTPEDLAKVLIDIQKSLINGNGVILQQNKAQEMMIQPIAGAPGLGVFVDKTNKVTYFHHSGSNLGFRCLMIANDQGQGAVIMTNSEFGNELIPEVVRKIAEVYDWKGRESLTIFPPLNQEVQETSQKQVDVDFKKKWGETHQGKYELVGREGKIASIVINKESNEIEFRTPNPKDPPFKITPVSEHVGIIKENGRVVPIEFRENSENNFNLTIHGWEHRKLKPFE
jgi:CubicO group peptidase (beta-lactamase class C family)